jgi:UDP-glucose 4-epimerase
MQNQSRPMNNQILVVGGAGYIGSHMVKLLLANGDNVVVLDDLSTGHRDAVLGGKFIHGNVGNPAILDQLFRSHQFDTVMHFASFIQVGDSVKQPSRYYENNVTNTINLLNAMARHQVPYFVFSSTAAIYGNPQYDPIDESHPMAPINPYGRSKWMIEQLLQDYEKAYGLRYVALRYFNAAGADPDGVLGERHEPETHLIPLAIHAAMGKLPHFTLFGDDYPTPDGTCIRDFIHVSDLCAAHLLAIRHLRAGKNSDVFNLGNGNGFSVKEVLDTVKSITKHQFKIQVTERRLGDPARLVADASKAREILKWSPDIQDLDVIVRHAHHFEQHRN